MIPGMHKRYLLICAILCFAGLRVGLCAQDSPDNICARPSAGATVPEPQDLRSQNGVLKVDLTVRNISEPGKPSRSCYVAGDGSESPTLRLHPGDLLILSLKNDLTDPDYASAALIQHHLHTGAKNAAAHTDNAAPCASGAMTSTSTNLHFHGLTIPPTCHQDDVLKTSIQPSDPPFE